MQTFSPFQEVQVTHGTSSKSSNDSRISPLHDLLSSRKQSLNSSSSGGGRFSTTPRLSLNSNNGDPGKYISPVNDDHPSVVQSGVGFVVHMGDQPTVATAGAIAQRHAKSELVPPMMLTSRLAQQLCPETPTPPTLSFPAPLQQSPVSTMAMVNGGIGTGPAIPAAITFPTVSSPSVTTTSLLTDTSRTTATDGYDVPGGQTHDLNRGPPRDSACTLVKDETSTTSSSTGTDSLPQGATTASPASVINVVAPETNQHIQVRSQSMTDVQTVVTTMINGLIRTKVTNVAGSIPQLPVVVAEGLDVQQAWQRLLSRDQSQSLTVGQHSSLVLPENIAVTTETSTSGVVDTPLFPTDAPFSTVAGSATSGADQQLQGESRGVTPSPGVILAEDSTVNASAHPATVGKSKGLAWCLVWFLTALLLSTAMMIAAAPRGLAWKSVPATTFEAFPFVGTLVRALCVNWVPSHNWLWLATGKVCKALQLTSIATGDRKK
ncbi:unnamed protein product, partial [Choristocarpus tenellus]